MKAELKYWNGEVFGVELTAHNVEEDAVLRQFEEGGIKINVVTRRPDNKSSLELTFADLIGK